MVSVRDQIQSGARTRTLRTRKFGKISIKVPTSRATLSTTWHGPIVIKENHTHKTTIKCPYIGGTMESGCSKNVVACVSIITILLIGDL